MKMSKQDETRFRDAAIDAFRGDGDLELMLSDIGLHPRHWPARRGLSPAEGWNQALHVLADSDVDGGQLALVRRAYQDRPRNPVFSSLITRYDSPDPVDPADPVGSSEPAAAAGGVKWDFFISYTQKDRSWAEWAAWTLEKNGYRVLIQAWDFVAGSSWTNKMQDGVVHATRMIAVLSAAYIESAYGTAEWQAMFRRDPLGAERRLIPVRVEECERPGLLDATGCDLFGVEEQIAVRRLLRCAEGAVRGRLKPDLPPPFPTTSAVPAPVGFPGGT
ncbi:toll/interleukin-1 receptor domain-containing protein [Actinoplanes derwentensis]|uniref:TIR domain-containing protein n=1 Tax=Actinoplanes derwentensis TaxID=113562 RepID=A0A1H2AJ06_9ACTN|nr:toll/interleukin-1 receptor domain-containing protein [Actinoplanes derwentensis]GID90292.1 hypothetical protein Ade03nite_92160 [Actinoplanes derwentensis]SDT45938.1 TIR domain-containing protein [Actinoplanes derwentensis]